MNNNINTRLGKRIAELRGNLHLSQEKLAERCGVHRTYIGALERGEKSPTLTTLYKLAKGLSVNINDLFV